MEPQGVISPPDQPTAPQSEMPVQDTSVVPTPESEIPIKSKRKILVITGVVILAVVILGISGYFSYKKFIIKPSPTPMATMEPTASPDPYEGWGVYENSEFGFKFKYPKKWLTPIEKIYSTQSAPGFFEINFNGKLLITAKDEKYSSPSTLEEIVSLNKNSQDVSSNNYKAYKVELDTGRTYIDISDSMDSVKVLHFEYFPTPETEAVYDQILNSFEFVETGEEDCVLSLCDCKCYPKGETREEKEGVLCGINCVGIYGVGGCEVVDGKCKEVVSQ